MDISMDFKSLSSYKKVFSGEYLCKLTSDAVIPDTYDDISRLLGTEFSCKVVSKDALFGKITVSGELETNSIFISENEDSPVTLKTVIPFSAEFSSDEIESSSMPIASFKIIASDWRELNPRKIGINADVLVTLDVYNKSELKFPTKLCEKANNVFYKSKSISFNYISAVSEKLSTLDDEREVGEVFGILSSCAEYISDSFEEVGSRLIVKGHAHCRVLLKMPNGSVSATEYSIPFSQLFDSKENADISECCLTILPAGEYFEIADGMLNTELRIVSQLVCFEHGTETCITDAYACGCDYELTKETLHVISSNETLPVNKTILLSYDLPSDAQNILINSLSLGKITKAESTVNVPVIVNAMYSDRENKLYSFRIRENIAFDDISCDEYEAYISSYNCAKISNTAQFELQITLKCISRKISNAVIISAIMINEESKRKEAPSLYLVRADSNDIWSIAKKYAADQNRIIAVNSITSDDNVVGKMLLIPM